VLPAPPRPPPVRVSAQRQAARDRGTDSDPLPPASPPRRRHPAGVRRARFPAGVGCDAFRRASPSPPRYPSCSPTDAAPPPLDPHDRLGNAVHAVFQRRPQSRPAHRPPHRARGAGRPRTNPSRRPRRPWEVPPRRARSHSWGWTRRRPATRAPPPREPPARHAPLEAAARSSPLPRDRREPPPGHRRRGLRVPRAPRDPAAADRCPGMAGRPVHPASAPLRVCA